MAEFVHLHNHSDYSLLDGAAPIHGLIQKALDLNMKHLALTDHGNMFGALHFYKQCKKAGINPIIGCEMYVAPKSRHLKSGSENGNKYFHLVLLARNEAGYKNLMKLSSLGYTEGFYYKPRVDDELLSLYTGGLIATSACLAGEIPDLIQQNRFEDAREKAGLYNEIFGKGNFYLELQDHGIAEQTTVNKALVQLSDSLDIPLVATNDVHYINNSDANAQDLLICVGTNKKKNEPGRMRFQTQEFYLKSAEEMARLFGEVPSSLKSTLDIADMCNIEIDLPGPLLPEYQIPQEYTSDAVYLKNLTFKGLERRYDIVTESIKERAEYELDVIISMGFTGYFLIVWDFIHFARERNIPVGPGRGSGAGSIVAYSLQITDIDPLKFGLLFERFLNPERVSMPDFDIDFCYERRQEVIDYVTQKYGEDKVSQIITFGTLKAKAVIRDVARVLDLPYEEANSIAKLIPAQLNIKLEDAIKQESRLAELEKKDPLHAELLETSRKLEGLSRHASTHAAGIVIGKKELTEYVPLYMDPKTKSISTQYTMDLLEECGLVKMDFLGLKTLTLIKNCQDLIREKNPDFDIETIPEDDNNTYKLLGKGKSTCVFQFESSGMQAILKRAKPTKIEDLIALNALYRPGPMAFIDQFIDSKWGRTPIKYPLPELKSVLEETYGVIVYQEQVMEIAQIVAGYTLGQADILRRAMGKKKVEVMAKQKVEFVKGSRERGYSEKQAEDIFELLIPFAGYGFNKSHATAYSVLAYKTAYLKANHPAEFMAANLTNEIHNHDKLAEYITESREMDLDLLPPNINLSGKHFSTHQGKIIYGLMGIKNLGSAAVDEIIRERSENDKYATFEEFLERVDLKTVNKKVLETGIQCGLFEGLSENRATLWNNLETLVDYIFKKKESSQFGQVSLFDSCEEEVFPTQNLEKQEEWSKAELLKFEKDHLGFYFSGHPLDKYRDKWKKTVTIDLSKPQVASADKKYNLLGIIKSIREIQTKTGRRMAFVQMEDFNGAIELVVFSSPFEKFNGFLEQDRIVGVTGKLDFSKGEPKLLVDSILEPEKLEENNSVEIHIRLATQIENEEELYKLRAYLFDRSGPAPVYLHIPDQVEDNESVIKVSSQITISPAGHILNEIREYPKIQAVWKQ
jgi:DNA polymerase III subunit alpha